MVLFPALLPQIPITLGGEEVTESSGLVVSSTQKGIFWTVNDSGDGPFLYAFDAKGRPRATVSVRGAEAKDWEDLASGPFPGRKGTWLYAADIGDNGLKRSDACVYAIPEPKVGPSSRENPLVSKEAVWLRLGYPDGRPHNAEALLCDPHDGRLTVVTKEPSGESGVFRFPPRPSARDVNALQSVATFRVPTGAGRSSLVTGGAYRPDGRAVALVTYSHVYELRGSPWWPAPPTERLHPKLKQCEAVAYARDGKSLWFTSEGKGAPLVEGEGEGKGKR